MIGDIIFFAFVYAFLGCFTAVMTLWDDIGRDYCKSVDFFGVALWWPFFLVKGILLVIVWIAKNINAIVINGFTILIGGQRASQKRRW